MTASLTPRPAQLNAAKDPYLMVAYLDGGSLVAAKGAVGPLEVRAADTYTETLYRPYQRSAGDLLPAELISAARVAGEHGRNLIITFPQWRKLARPVIGFGSVLAAPAFLLSYFLLPGWAASLVAVAGFAVAMMAGIGALMGMWNPFEPKLYHLAHQLRGWKVQNLDRTSTGLWRAAIYTVEQDHKPDSILPVVHGLAIQIADIEDEIDVASTAARYRTVNDDPNTARRAQVAALLAEGEALIGRRIAGHELNLGNKFTSNGWAETHIDQPATPALNPKELR